MTCNICQGNRAIDIPTYATLASVGGPDIVDTPALDPGYETFPCPKCGPLRVKVERIGALKLLDTIRERKYPGFVEHIKADLACRMGREMLKNNWIDFEERFDKFSGNTILYATGYVAHPDIGRVAISSQEPKPPQQPARKSWDVSDVKVTITFDPDVGTGREATIKTEQPSGEVREYRAAMVDCSIRLGETESYQAANSPFQRRVYAGPQPFDLSVDLKCDGIAIQTKDGDGTPSALINAPEPRDPFAREIDIE